MSGRKYRIGIEGRTFEVEVGDLGDSPVRVVVDGQEYQVDLPGRASAPAVSTPSNAAPPAPIAGPPPTAAGPAAGAPVRSAGGVTAMMPGRIISVEVKAGDEVKRGDTVCVIESMKMEQAIASPRDGRVASVPVSAGDSVQRGQTLVELE